MAIAKDEVKISFKVFNEDFNKAMNEMKQGTTELNREFKLQKSQMKLSGSETDKLRTSVDYLSKRYDQAKERVKLTEEQLAKAKKTFGENSEEVRKLEGQLVNAKIQEQNFANELATTTKMLKDATDPLKNYGKQLEDVGGKFKNAGKKISEVGGSLTKKITLPLAGVAGVAIKLGSNYDDQMSTVQAVTGATASEMGSLSDQAREMGKTTRYSAREAALGQENLARAGFTLNEISDSLGSTLNLATAGAIDLGQASEITASTIRGFSMEANDAERVSDVLSYTTSATKTNISGLGESFKMVAPVANTLGFDIEETSAAIGILGDNAIEGSQAGNMLKRGLLNLSKPTKQQADLMNSLGMNFFDANGEMKPMADVIAELEGGLEGMSSQQRTAAMATIFGSEAVSGWSALVNTGSDRLRDLQGGLESSNGYAQAFAETAEDNLAGSFRSLKSSTEELMISFYEMGEGPVRSLVDWFTGLIDKFSGLSDTAKQWVIIIGGVAAAIGPVMFVFGKFTQTLGGVITTGGKLMQNWGSITAFGGKMAGFLKPLLGGLFSPWGIAIAAAIAAGVLIWKNWDTIKEKAKQLKDAVVKRITELKENTLNKFNELRDGAKEKFDAARNAIINPINTARDRVSNAINNLRENTVSRFNSLRNSITNTFNNIRNAITNPINTARDRVSSTVDNIRSRTVTSFNSLRSSVSSIFNNVRNAIVNPINSARDKVSSAINKIKGFFSNLKLKFPKIPAPKLPSFSLKGSFSLAPPSVPKLSVSWKSEGAIFRRPTVLNGIGIGDGYKGTGSGMEAVLPISKLADFMRDVIPESYAQPVATTNISFNGNYQFRDESDIDYFMQKAARIIKGEGR